jgi:superfamily II DNA or RNA helicase
MIPFDHELYNKNATGLDYPEFYRFAIVENVRRNQLIIDEVAKLLKDGHPSLVIVKAIDHGRILKEMMQASGIGRVEFIYGDVDPMERIRLRELFNEGHYDVLIGSTVFDTAINLHRASGLVLAASGNSKIRAPQRVGRVLSQVMGKVAVVKDIKDMNVKWFEDDARDRQQVYVGRYGQTRVKVRGVEDVTELEKRANINYSKMFDNLGI